MTERGREKQELRPKKPPPHPSNVVVMVLLLLGPTEPAQGPVIFTADRGNKVNAEILQEQTVSSDSVKCIKTHWTIFHHQDDPKRRGQKENQSFSGGTLSTG